MKTHTVRVQAAEFWAWLRLEALVELGVMLLLYHRMGGSWLLLAALFLLPDLAMLGYLAGPRTGAMAYNFVHSYAVAGSVIVGIWLIAGAVPVAWLVWPVHIALDRALGYGLKSVNGFSLTHLSEPSATDAA